MTVKHERHLLHFAGSIQGYLILIFVLPFGLAGVDVLPSPLSGTHKIVEVIFAYTNCNTDYTEKFFVRVDVTEEFPFLVTKLLLPQSAIIRPR